MLRGLDLKGVSHVINWDVAVDAEYFMRAGRCVRKGQVHREGRVITLVREGDGSEEVLHRMVHAMGGKGVSQLVVRGERLYERGRSRLQLPLTARPPLPASAQPLRPMHFIDEVLSGGAQRGAERGGTRLLAAA